MYWMCGGVVDGMLPDIAVQGTQPLAGYDFLQLRTGPEKVGVVVGGGIRVGLHVLSILN